MTVGSGLCSQFGLVAETTVGTGVTVNRFHPVRSFRPNHTTKVATSEGLRSCGKAITDDRTVLVGRAATADVELEVLSKGFGLIFKHLMGGSTAATQIGTTGVYRQVATVGDLTGLSLTMQAGFPESYGSATVRPYTYRGGKFTQWEFAASPSQSGGLLIMRGTVDFWDWTNGTALAAASYPTGLEPFRWGGDGTVLFMEAKIGGTVDTTAGLTTITGGTAIKGLRGISVKGQTPLRTDRDNAGGAGIKSEQLENGFRMITAELDVEFADRTQLNDLQDAYTSTALELVFRGANLTGGRPPIFSIIMPIVKLAGSPEISGPDLLNNKFTATAYLDNTGTHPLTQFVYESTDAAV